MNISNEQVNKIFELASMKDKISKDNITENDITEALIVIERKIYSFSSEVKVDSLQNRKILIADDLELSIYQLSTVLKKIGITPSVARHKDEAVKEMQKAHFDCIILDLFIPDSSDGFDLIQSAVEKRNEEGLDYKIVVISGTDDNSLVEHCYELGADFYIQKDGNWHSKLLKFLSSSFHSDKTAAFTRYTINNDIVSYIIKNFNETKIFDELIKNINTSIYTGVKHVIFDLKEITAFDADNVYIFADIYKMCAENGGKFILINPSVKVKEALAFAYLEDVIPCKNSVEEAVSLVIEQTAAQ